MGHVLLLAAGRLRTMMVLAFGVGVLVVPAPAALADPPTTPPRADVYVQVWCRTPDGIEAFERVDIHSVEQGNKDLQVAAFGLHHEGWFCQIGPFA